MATLSPSSSSSLSLPLSTNHDFMSETIFCASIFCCCCHLFTDARAFAYVCVCAHSHVPCASLLACLPVPVDIFHLPHFPDHYFNSCDHFSISTVSFFDFSLITKKKRMFEWELTKGAPRGRQQNRKKNCQFCSSFNHTHVRCRTFRSCCCCCCCYLRYRRRVAIESNQVHLIVHIVYIRFCPSLFLPFAVSLSLSFSLSPASTMAFYHLGRVLYRAMWFALTRTQTLQQQQQQYQHDHYQCVWHTMRRAILFAPSPML